MGGRLVLPEAPNYDEHRAVWNGSIDRYAAEIARCADVADVIAAPGRPARYSATAPGPALQALLLRRTQDLERAR